VQLITVLDRAMIALSGARVVADLLVLTVAPQWRHAAAQVAPLVSTAQVIWVISALRRADQRGPYSGSSGHIDR
jgi:hypothetical protein